MKNVLLVVIVILVLFAFASFFISSAFSKAARNNKGAAYIKKKQNKENFWTKLYLKLSSWPIAGKYIISIRDRLYVSVNSDEYAIRAKAARVFSIALVISVSLYVLLFNIYGTDFYMKATMFVLCLYFNNIIIEKFIGDSGIRLLNDLPESLDDIKHEYHKNEMVAVAVNEAAKKAKSHVQPYLYDIYNVLNSVDSKFELRKFYSECPNRFLKIIAGFSYLIKNFGDVKVDGVSVFVKNLNYLKQEINIEKLKIMQLKNALSKLPIFILIPLFFPPLFELYVKYSFPMARDFYESATAFFIKNFIIFVILACYILVTQMKKVNINRKYEDVEDVNNRIEYKLIKIPFVKELVKIIRPKDNTPKYNKCVDLLDDSGSFLNVDTLYLRRIAIGIVVFFLMVIMFNTSHMITKNQIKKDASYGIKNNNIFAMMGKVDADEQKDLDEINKYDAQVIETVSDIGKGKDELKKYIHQKVVESGYDKEVLDIAAERIYNKYVALKEQHFKLFELLVALVFAWGSSFIPVLMLIFQKKLRQDEVEDEIFQFHTIILLLMNHKNADVKIILEWMSQFSNIYKNPINKCLNNFHNRKEALEELKNSVKEKGFKQLVENLAMASNQIDISAAFDSLEVDRDYHKEKRMESNKTNVNNRVVLGKFVTLVPLGLTLAAYLVLPLLLTVFMKVKDVMQQFSSLR